jgi:hypothetical protein
MPLTARELAQAVLGGTYKDRGWNVGASAGVRSLPVAADREDDLPLLGCRPF